MAMSSLCAAPAPSWVKVMPLRLGSVSWVRVGKGDGTSGQDTMSCSGGCKECGSGVVPWHMCVVM